MGGRGAQAGIMGGNPAVAKTLNKIIKQTANLKKEQYRIVDAEGNIVAKAQGDAHSVSLSVGEKREKLDGATSIHNHPEGGTFSGADLKEFGFGAREIVVATPEGTYRLINTKYGTKEQTSGWLPLQNEINKIADNQSAISDRRKAQDIVAKTKEGKRAKAIANEWVKQRNAGASKDVLDKLYNEYDGLTKKIKQMTDKEARRLEVEPYHEYYKQNARKYGFKYVFTKN